MSAPSDNKGAEQTDLAKQLKMMNQLFFASLNQTTLGYRVDPTETNFFNNASTTSPTLSNLNNLFANHSDIESLPFFNVQTPASTVTVDVKAQDNSDPTKYVAKLMNDSASLSNTWNESIRNKIANDTGRVVDINLYSLATNTSCQEFMDVLYAWHDLCDEDKWEAFLTKSDGVELKKAQLSTGSTKSNVTERITKDGALSGFKEKMNNLLSFNDMVRSSSTVDRFMVQRLLYVYIRLLQFQLGMRYVKNAYTSGIADKKVAWALPAAVIGILDRDTRDLGTVIKNVEDVTLQRKGEYTKLNTDIGKLHDTIDKGKTSIRNQIDRVNTESKYESRSKTMTIASFVILLVVAIGAVVTLILPLEKPKRLMAAGATLTVAALSALILSVVFSKTVVESFASYRSAFVSPLGADTIADTISIENGIILFSGEMRRQVLQYLQQCSMLVSAVKSFQILGNINYTMAKENRYYTDMNGQIVVSNEKIRGTHRTSDLIQKQYSANMYLFITLSIIIGATLLAFIAFDNYAGVRTVILGIAAFFVVLSFVIYVLEHSSYVRTDGDKKYWSQPANTGMMMSP